MVSLELFLSSELVMFYVIFEKYKPILTHCLDSYVMFGLRLKFCEILVFVQHFSDRFAFSVARVDSIQHTRNMHYG